jgi:hypothetical protein
MQMRRRFICIGEGHIESRESYFLDSLLTTSEALISG